MRYIVSCVLFIASIAQAADLPDDSPRTIQILEGKLSVDDPKGAVDVFVGPGLYLNTIAVKNVLQALNDMKADNERLTVKTNALIDENTALAAQTGGVNPYVVIAIALGSAIVAGTVVGVGFAVKK